MGLIIARWENSEDDGIYWMGDEPEEYTLFEVMERYLTTGETLEILSYSPDNRQDEAGHQDMVAMLYNERKAHGETE